MRVGAWVEEAMEKIKGTRTGGIWRENRGKKWKKQVLECGEDVEAEEGKGGDTETETNNGRSRNWNAKRRT